MGLVVAPLSAGSSVVATAFVGTTAAHAAGAVACVTVNPTAVTAGSCGAPSANDDSAASNPATAAINVCVGGGGGAFGPDSNDIVVVSAGNTQIWADVSNLAGPDGMAEVDGIGIASNQTGC
ncbi:MAG: hypothetical protein ACYDD6_01230 [Acidimicrobiales bacterium]